MAAKPVFEAWVKGDPEKEVLGDCEPLHTSLKGAVTDEYDLSIAHKVSQIMRNTLPFGVKQRMRFTDTECGAGPFCHRALLTLEEKKVPYEAHYINLANKPEW